MVSRTSAVPTTTTGTSNASTGGLQTTNTTGQSNTSQSSSGSQSTSQQNLSDSSLSALDQLIASLGGGSSNGFAVKGGGKKSNGDKGSQLTNQWQGQIDKLNQLAGDYSKSAAFADSDVAVQGALSQALEKTLPTITAGIQAAGTSGSSMSALLTQKAAEDAAYNAAQLGVQAAVSYGNIQANALSSAGSLISSGDPAMNQLLAALGIAKGAVTQTNSSTSQNSSSSTNSSQQSQTATNQNSSTNQSQTTGPSVGTKDSTPTSSNSTGLSSSGQNWYTPSSYKDSGASSSVNSYSQFQ